MEKLIKEFYIRYNKHGFNSVIYENAIIELSSWVNQSLIIGNSNKNIKDLRYFFEYHCNEEIDRIKNIKIKNNFEIFFEKEAYDFRKLFVHLSQLYTEIQLYSGKKN